MDAEELVYLSSGKGQYNLRFDLDGKNDPQEIPPTDGLKGINRITSTGHGKDLSYWNRYDGITPSYALRSATEQPHRTAERALATCTHFHNGSAPTLDAVVRIYNTKGSLGLKQNEILDTTEYPKSL